MALGICLQCQLGLCRRSYGPTRFQEALRVSLDATREGLGAREQPLLQVNERQTSLSGNWRAELGVPSELLSEQELRRFALAQDACHGLVHFARFRVVAPLGQRPLVARV